LQNIVFFKQQAIPDEIISSYAQKTAYYPVSATRQARSLQHVAQFYWKCLLKRSANHERKAHATK